MSTVALHSSGIESAWARSGKRRPWTSAFLKDDDDKALRVGRLPVQYFVDRDGFPMRTSDGCYVDMLLDEHGQLVLDETGTAVLIPIEPPSA